MTIRNETNKCFNEKYLSFELISEDIDEKIKHFAVSN